MHFSLATTPLFFLSLSTLPVLFLRPQQPFFSKKQKLLPPPKKKTTSLQPSGYSVADWAAAFDSQLEEFDYEISKKNKGEGGNGNNSSPVAFIEGEIPRVLCGGTLYRNGPARFERGGKRYAHMLDGDGYVCRFEFSEDGEGVGFRSRFVKTR